jgi:regulator of sirC expression with transglutaminase-like and TPR domain
MDRSLRAFGELVRSPRNDFDLGRGATLVAQVEHPDLAPEPHLERLDELARRSGAGRLSSAAGRLGRLREFLFEAEGFRGNADDYYDPRNSCLNDVLDRKLGIPITLSVLMMEIGRRAGVVIEGIGLPGHFVVAARVDGERVLLDPFHGGAVITPEAAGDLASRAVGRAVRLAEAHLAPVPPRAILARMLANLKGIYIRAEAWPKALAAIDRLLLLDPGAWPDRRDRGAVLLKLGHFQQGLADWEAYLARHPDASDAGKLRAQLIRFRQALASLN